MLKQKLAAKIRGSLRARLVSSLLIIFCAAALVWGFYWLLVLRGTEHTDDAYVAGNLVQITPQVTGTVAAIFVDDTQGVKAGQVLVHLDDTDAKLALNRARLALADAVRQTAGRMAESERLATVVDLRRAELARAQGDYSRRLAARASKTLAVSEEDLMHARDALNVARVALRVAERDLATNQALLLNTPIAEQPEVLLKAHQMREAWLELLRCDIKSPVDGFVAKRSVQVGAHIAPGTPLMAVVPLQDVWVNANFKEVQLKDMRIGQSASVSVDFYGGKVEFHGTVAGFNAGTGSSFSLLPPENATGNWIKVVQRLPVKIVIPKEELAEHPLFVGLSCLVSVKTSEGDGPMLFTPKEGSAAYSTTILDYDLSRADTEIAEIIRVNSSSIAGAADKAGE